MKITFATRDGIEFDAPNTADQTTLEAAEAAGYFLASSCREGSCGQCAATVTSGEFALGPHSPEMLPKGKGGVLLCVCHPKSDLRIALPYTEAKIGRQRILERIATITALEHLAQATIGLSLKLAPDEELGESVDFAPGQYMELSLPGRGVRRAYSLSNLPNWDGTLDFVIREAPHGVFTTWLSQNAMIGDELIARGPFGNFGINAGSLRSRLFIGGGCGIAPLLSMLRQMAAFQDPIPVELIYGANHEAELLSKETLDELLQNNPRLKITLCVANPNPDWAGTSGLVTDALTQRLETDGRDFDLYVCGPPRMVDATREVARSFELSEEQFHSESIQMTRSKASTEEPSSVVSR